MEALSRLLQVVRAGDFAAFEQSLQSDLQRLHKQAERLLDSRLRHILSPEDIVQETVLQAYRFLANQSLDDGQSFDAWIFAILEKVVLSARRRHCLTQKRAASTVSLATAAGHTSSGNGYSLESQIPGKVTSPSVRAERHELQGKLPKALAALRPEYRLVIQLVRLDGKSFSEAAAVLEKTEGATRKLLSRALEELVSVLPRTGGQP